MADDTLTPESVYLTGQVPPPSEAAAMPKAPRIKSKQEFDLLESGAEFIADEDPSGQVRRKPYIISSPEEFASVPDGAPFISSADPNKEVQTKPVYEGVSFTAQTLYDMANNDKERENALRHTYGDKVSRDMAGEFFVNDNGVRRKPGRGVTSFLGRTAAETAPMLGMTGGAALGGLGGGTAGSAVAPGPGTVAGGAAAGYAGMVGGAMLGKSFNNLVLSLAGVYESTPAEELSQLSKEGAMAATGEVVGRGIGKAVGTVAGGLKSAKNYAAGLPAAARSLFGADEEDLLRAQRLASEGVQVGMSSWAKETPMIRYLEQFDRMFRRQDVLGTSAKEHFEKTGKGILEDVGVTPAEPLTKATAKPSSQQAGELVLKQIRLEQARADAEVENRIRDVKSSIIKDTISSSESELSPPVEKVVAATYTVKGKTYTGPNHVAAMDAAKKDLNLTWYDELIDLNNGLEGHHAADGFLTSTGRVVDRKEASKIAENAEQGRSSRPGSLKMEDISSKPKSIEEAVKNRQAALDNLVRAQAEAKAKAQEAIDASLNEIRKQADQAIEIAKVGGNPGDAWRAVGAAYETTIQAIKKRAGTMYAAADAAAGDVRPAAGGLAADAEAFLASLPKEFRDKYPREIQQLAEMAGERDPKTGEWLRPPSEPTFGQLRRLRSFFRAGIDYTDLTPDMREGSLKLFEKRINSVLHSSEAAPELKQAVQLLDQADAFYGQNVPFFGDEQVKTIIKGLESGTPSDPKALAKILFDPNRTEAMAKTRSIVGENLWAAVRAADTQTMLDQSLTHVPGQIDGSRFAQQVLDRVRNGIMKTAYDDTTAKRMQELARNILGLEGSIPVKAREGDTISMLVEKANAATEAAKRLADADLFKSLQKEMTRLDKELSVEQRALRNARSKSPLGFLYPPQPMSQLAIASADKILGSPDLLRASAQHFGIDSEEFKALQQVYIHRFLQRPVEGLGKMRAELARSATEETQALMFPGVTLENMKTLVKDMEFLFSGHESDFGGSLAGASRVLHPISELPIRVPHGLSSMPGAGFLARLPLGKFYAMMVDSTSNRTFINWVARGLRGTPEERLAARRAVQQAIGSAGDAGAALGRTTGVGYQNSSSQQQDEQ